MPKRNTPDTSKLAQMNFTQQQIEIHQQKIVSALKVLQLANAFEIAVFLKMEHAQINRRLKVMREMVGAEIYRTEIKHKTKNNNQGYCYALTGVELPTSIFEGIMPSGAKTEKALKGETIADISRNIQGIQEKMKQGSMFY